MLSGMPTNLPNAPIETILLTIDGSHLALALAVAAVAVAAGMLAHGSRMPRGAVVAAAASGRRTGDESRSKVAPTSAHRSFPGERSSDATSRSRYPGWYRSLWLGRLRQPSN